MQEVMETGKQGSYSWDSAGWKLLQDSNERKGGREAPRDRGGISASRQAQDEESEIKEEVVRPVLQEDHSGIRGEREAARRLLPQRPTPSHLLPGTAGRAPPPTLPAPAGPLRPLLSPPCSASWRPPCERSPGPPGRTVRCQLFPHRRTNPVHHSPRKHRVVVTSVRRNKLRFSRP